MFIQADELVNNKDKNTVTAEGHARIYYKGRVLQADRVVYDRNTNRVYAEGHASLTERDGTIVHAQRFDLTEDFRRRLHRKPAVRDDGQTYFSAPRAERSGDDITVFDKGTYTACQTCRDNPDKPPLWRVRAKRIIHNQEEQMIYYDQRMARIRRHSGRLFALLFVGRPDGQAQVGRADAPTYDARQLISAPASRFRSSGRWRRITI